MCLTQCSQLNKTKPKTNWTQSNPVLSDNQIQAYLTTKLCFEPDETGFMFNCWNVRLCSIEFDYVWLLNWSIRSIGKQVFWVSSIKFDYRTQADSFEWLGLLEFNYRMFDWQCWDLISNLPSYIQCNEISRHPFPPSFGVHVLSCLPPQK